jgi:hypothetical protein
MAQKLRAGEQSVAVRQKKVLVRRIYDNVHAALWASLVALVLYYIFVIFPKFPEIRNQAEIRRAGEITAEHEYYCAKWGMRRETQAHDQCLIDIQQFRSKVEKRIADESEFF